MDIEKLSDNSRRGNEVFFTRHLSKKESGAFLWMVAADLSHSYVLFYGSKKEL